MTVPTGSKLGPYEILAQIGAGGMREVYKFGGGFQPRWRRDGRQLFYVSTNNELMAVEVDGQTAQFAAKTPRILLRVNLFFGPRRGFFSYDVSPDGRFLVNSTGEGEQPRAALVVNWDAELQK